MKYLRGLGILLLCLFSTSVLLGGDKNDRLEVVSAFDPITFTIGDIVGAPGDIVCVPITVDDFENVVSIQFSFNFDPNVLSYTSFQNPNTLIGLGNGNFNVNNPNGFINFVWFDPNVGTTGGVTLPDGTEIFSLCFEILGDPGEDGNLNISGVPLSIEITQTDNGDDCSTDEIVVIEGDTNIGCGEFNVYANACSTTAADNNGTIQFYVCGGFAPYSYTVNAQMGIIANDFDQIVIDNLPPGVYSVTVIDDNGTPVSSGPLEIIDAPSLAIDPIITAPTCFGDDDGEISITVSGGVQKPGADPYCYAWSTNQYNVDNIDDLVSGTYSVTVTDDLGCTASSEFDMNVDQISVDIVIDQQASCVGVSNGIATATANGGTSFPGGEYQYSWNSVPQLFEQSISSTNNSIPVGEYIVRVTDSNGCTTEEMFEMTPAKELDSAVVVDSVSCFGGNDGSAVIEAITIGPETPPFSFLVQHENGTFVFGVIDPTNNTCTKNDLIAGTYNVTIQDNDGCVLESDFEVFEPEALSIEIASTLDCSNPDDGMIVATVTGGTEEYTYEWDNGDMDDTLESVSEGTYRLTVTDANMCQDSVEVDLTVAGSLVIDSFSVNHVNCNGDMDGSITVNVSSSSNNLTFDWGADGMGQTLSNLDGGRYYVTVSDDGGCSTTDSIDVLEPESLMITPTFTLPSCPGESNGAISVLVEGGMDPYNYDWDFNPDPGLPLLPGLEAGNYAITVTDANGCSVETELTLDDPPAIIVDITNITGVSCVGVSPGDGTALATASGGNPIGGNYNYIWSSTEFENGVVSNAALLESGTQWVIATDGVCASDTFFFEVDAPTAISLDLTNSDFTNPICFRDCNGTANVAATGGNPPYNFNWVASGNNGPFEPGLCAGWQYVLITDSNNCEVLDSFLLTEPDTLIIEIDPFSTFDINCFDGATGAIGTVQSGGNPGSFTYTWTNNVSDGTNANNLTIGTYTVTVTDVLGCTDITTYEVAQPEPIEAVIPSPMDPACFGEQTCITVTDATGGAGPNYKFTINNGPQFELDSCINVFAGTYTVTVFDRDGCSIDTTFSINQPPELTVDLGDDFSVNLGSDDSVLEAIVTSSLPIDTIIWTPDLDVDCIDPDCFLVNIAPTVGQEYTVTVVDANGCIAIDEVFVDLNNNRNIYIPNAFTPDGDGNNDLFQIFTGEGVEMIDYFIILDRWGNIVHRRENIMPIESGAGAWDGRLNGEEMNPGVYTYSASVTFSNNIRLVYSGDVTLIR